MRIRFAAAITRLTAPGASSGAIARPPTSAALLGGPGDAAVSGAPGAASLGGGGLMAEIPP